MTDMSNVCYLWADIAVQFSIYSKGKLFISMYSVSFIEKESYILCFVSRFVLEIRNHPFGF